MEASRVTVSSRADLAHETYVQQSDLWTQCVGMAPVSREAFDRND
jgi:hypothetical protein